MGLVRCPRRRQKSILYTKCDVDSRNEGKNGLCSDDGTFFHEPMGDGTSKDHVGWGFGINVEEKLKIDVTVAEDLLFRNPFQGEGRLFSRIDATYSLLTAFPKFLVISRKALPVEVPFYIISMSRFIMPFAAPCFSPPVRTSGTGGKETGCLSAGRPEVHGGGNAPASHDREACWTPLLQDP